MWPKFIFKLTLLGHPNGQTRPISGINLVWNLGSWIRVKKIDFYRKIFEKFRFFQTILEIIFDFSSQIFKKYRFFRQFPKKFQFSRQKLAFTATFGQIILFLFKSHHFRTYFLYMIRYNSISRPPATPQPPCPKSGRSRPQPPQNWCPWDL